MHKVKFIEYVVIAFYLIFMMGTGVMFRKFVGSFGDYFKSGCKGSWWLVGSSAFMASFSAWTFTGASGMAYKTGITVSLIYIANVLGYLINYFFTAKLFRQMRATTFPEVINSRFGPITQQAYVWIGTLPGILMASLTLYGVAIFTNSVFGFNLQYTIIGLGIVVLVYSTVGGSWSVMATDFLQTLILMPMAVLMTYLSLKKVGGFSAMIDKIHALDLGNMLQVIEPNEPGNTYTWIWTLAFLTFVVFTYNSLGFAVRYFSCKDGEEARKASLLAAVLMFVGCVIWFIPPIVARLEFHELVQAIPDIAKKEEASYAVIAMQLLPSGLAGLIVVAMFSATMSSLDTSLNQTAAVMTQDIYEPAKKWFLKENTSDKEMFFVGQIISLLTGIGIIVAALYFSKQEGAGVFKYMLDFGALFGTPMIVPMFLSMFIRKTPSWSALFSIIIGFILSTLAYKGGWSYYQTVLSITGAGSVAFIGSMFFWNSESEQYKNKVAAFYKQMHTPVDFEKEIGGAIDGSQLNMLGAISVLIGIFISLLVFIKNPTDGRIQILCVGATMCALGAMLLFFGIRAVKKQKELENE